MENSFQLFNTTKLCLSINFITFLFLISINISIISSEDNNYVYFPLKRKDNTYLNKLKNITEIMRFLYLEPLISELTIGTPEQKSNILFRTDCTYIYLTSFNHNTSHPDQTSEFIKLKYGNFNYFNEDKSNSINYYEKNYSHGNYAYDNQYFTRCISENVKINNKNVKLDLMLSKSIEYEEPGAICLQLDQEDWSILHFTASFPVLLKRNFSLINNYKWFIYYGKKKDYLVLGASPYEFKDPETDKKIYPDLDIDNDYNYQLDERDIWKAAMTIKFNDIYLTSNSNNEKEKFEDDKNLKGKLVPNIGFIVGTTNYSNYLEKNIFGKYLDSNQCHYGIFSQRPDLTGQEYNYYYCDESLYKNIKKVFKNIIFKQINLYENFELTFDDLFLKKNGYLIFLVIFSTHQHYYWSLGTPFLKKYQFDFEFDLDATNSKIGYYHIKKKEKENESNTLKYILYSIFILVLSGILIVLGIYLGKNYFNLRKKRANELDDDYEYKQKKEDNNNLLVNE